jgi:hypothetical protein
MAFMAVSEMMAVPAVLAQATSTRKAAGKLRKYSDGWRGRQGREGEIVVTGQSLGYSFHS